LVANVVPKVFVSYSHKDKVWLDRLGVHLAPLTRSESLDVWDDTRLKPGTVWRDAIAAALADADVAVLLVSPDFLASPFIAEHELPHLLDRAAADGLLVFWIPVRSSNVLNTPIAGYQAAHDASRPLAGLKPAQRDAAFVEIVNALVKAAVPRTTGHGLNEQPSFQGDGSVRASGAAGSPSSGPATTRESDAEVRSRMLAQQITARVERPNAETRRKWHMDDGDEPWTLYVQNDGDQSVEIVRRTVTSASGDRSHQLPDCTDPLDPGGPDNEYILRDKDGVWFDPKGERPTVSIEFDARGFRWRNSGGVLEMI